MGDGHTPGCRATANDDVLNIGIVLVLNRRMVSSINGAWLYEGVIIDTSGCLGMFIAINMGQMSL